MRGGSATPYEAVLGRVPRLFDVVGTEAGPDIQGRDADRLRSKAISSMIQATASSKLERASKHKSRVTGELLELSPGEQVDYWGVFPAVRLWLDLTPQVPSMALGLEGLPTPGTCVPGVPGIGCLGYNASNLLRHARHLRCLI